MGPKRKKRQEKTKHTSLSKNCRLHKKVPFLAYFCFYNIFLKNIKIFFKKLIFADFGGEGNKTRRRGGPQGKIAA